MAFKTVQKDEGKVGFTQFLEKCSVMCGKSHLWMRIWKKGRKETGEASGRESRRLEVLGAQVWFLCLKIQIFHIWGAQECKTFLIFLHKPKKGRERLG